MQRRNLLAGLMAGLSGLLGGQKMASAAFMAAPVPAPLPPHTCKRQGLDGEAMESLTNELVQKYLGTPAGRSKLLQSTHVLTERPMWSCPRCEARIQGQMRQILDALQGDERGWMGGTSEQWIEPKTAADRLRGLLDARSSAMPVG